MRMHESGEGKDLKKEERAERKPGFKGGKKPFSRKSSRK